eukprot:scaffold82176_cov28-Prasinocladus_malaysianus.AAC.2
MCNGSVWQPSDSLHVVISASGESVTPASMEKYYLQEVPTAVDGIEAVYLRRDLKMAIHKAAQFGAGIAVRADSPMHARCSHRCFPSGSHSSCSGSKFVFSPPALRAWLYLELCHAVQIDGSPLLMGTGPNGGHKGAQSVTDLFTMVRWRLKEDDSPLSYILHNE